MTARAGVEPAGRVVEVAAAAGRRRSADGGAQQHVPRAHVGRSRSPRAVSSPSELVARVAADVADGLVVGRPEPAGRTARRPGTCRPGAAARRPLARRGVVVVEVLEHVEGDAPGRGWRRRDAAARWRRRAAWPGPALGARRRRPPRRTPARRPASRGRAAPGCCRRRRRRRPGPCRAAGRASARASRCRRSRYHQCRSSSSASLRTSVASTAAILPAGRSPAFPAMSPGAACRPTALSRGRGRRR